MDPPAPRWIIAGTGVGPTIGMFYYGRMAQTIGASTIECLSSWGWDHTDRSVEKIVKSIEYKNVKPTLIGHSQGGLVATLVALRYPQLVDKVVTICAPLNGTPMAWGSFPPCTSCMNPSSKLCKEVQSQELQVPLITIAASRDLLVPLECALKGDNRHVIDSGHIDIVNNYQFLALLNDLIW